MGAESTPKKMSAASDMAASSFIDVLPQRFTIPFEMSSSGISDNIRSAVSISLSTGAEVRTIFIPLSIIHPNTSAMYLSSQHFHIHRDVGCIWTTVSSSLILFSLNIRPIERVASSGIKKSRSVFRVVIPNCPITSRFCKTICF
ncbi:hypothetical protein BMS3Bbin09_01223 [bacterium BMS3Bbin09]|nr:hypothetical protein BMS3Bbin09_01223 [bacterium BMS3Bbin09]